VTLDLVVLRRAGILFAAGLERFLLIAIYNLLCRICHYNCMILFIPKLNCSSVINV